MNSRRCVIPAVLALACSAFACSAAPEPIASEDQPFSTILAGEPVHEEITASALAFLRPEIVSAIQAANVSVDIEFALVNANHFDDCNFSGGADVIRAYQTEAVAALDPANLAGDAIAITAFGRWLHTVQDFYSHSNYVELGGQGIVESTLGPWPMWSGYEAVAFGFVLVQGNPPRRTSVTRPSDQPYPQNAVVRVKTQKNASPGLITGSVDYEPGDFCPQQVEMSHADLNKDKSDIPGRTAQFVTAKQFAVDQTRHEWCRLVSMTRAAWGDAGLARVMLWAADTTAASCGE